MSDSAFPPRTASTGIWHSLNRFVLTLIVLTGVVPIAYSFLPEVSRHKGQEAVIEELKAKVEKQRLILARHKHEEALLKNDPEYVGIIARDRLDLMKEGETIYRVAPAAPVPSQMRLKR